MDQKRNSYNMGNLSNRRKGDNCSSSFYCIFCPLFLLQYQDFRAWVCEIYNCLNFNVSKQVTNGISYYLTTSYPLIYLSTIVKRDEERFFREGSGVCEGTGSL